VAKNLNPLFLKPDSLDWAREHINKFGDGDIFPVPFEFAALTPVWTGVRDYLVTIDIANSEITGSLKMMIPKHSEGFRGATQLNPFDALLYTALIFESAKTIEAFRKPPQVACAYRLEVNADGRLFRKDSGWSEFHSASERQIQTGKYRYVLTADISDFYNQISHHRLQSALAQAGVDENRSKVIERFLGNVNAGHHSRGIPVGPAVSILLAEACLADVDNFLARKYSHVRYVDDFRIFCQNREQALIALHDLSEYLYTAHRLSLQFGKTRILSRQQFEEEELTDPEAEEKEAKEARIKEALEEWEAAGYPSWEPDDNGEEENGDKEHTDGAAPVDQAKIASDVLKDFLNEILKAKYFPLGLARYVLRRAATLRSRAVLPDIIVDIEKFTPVLRDLVLYFIKVSQPGAHDLIRSGINRLAASDFGSLPFIQYWILTLIHKVPELSTADSAMLYAAACDPSIRDRMLALTAAAYGLTDWVRGKKETWSNASTWAQRATVWSGAVLPRDERNHWLQAIRNNSDRSIKAVADAVFILNKDAP
jgi:Reverse transcriptase (RNA-dependent DNA polymerase)